MIIIKFFTYSQAKTRFFWSQTIEGHTVHFDNTPFTVSAIRELDCQFGNSTTKSTQGSLIVPDYRAHEKLVARHTLQFARSHYIPISSFQKGEFVSLVYGN